MHQNMFTIQNIISCKTKFDDNNVMQNKTITSFDFSKSKYEVGQWVDVKDTIDQWLEAQVIQVRNGQAYVHYNGWGTRWDEWIDFSSPRIATFRTYTLQSPTSIFSSPYPAVPCDANLEPQPRSIDSFYYMDKSLNYMNDIIKGIETIGILRKKNISNMNEERKENYVNRSNQYGNNLSSYDMEMIHHATQLIPLMDRCGRFLSDISLHLSHLVLILIYILSYCLVIIKTMKSVKHSRVPANIQCIQMKDQVYQDLQELIMSTM